MVDTAQVTLEYTAGNTMAFFSDDVEITWGRPLLEIVVRPDNVLRVIDPGVGQRSFSCSAILSAANVNTLNTVQTGAIDYTGAYPRLSVVYLDGTTTLTNVEVAITSLRGRMVANGWWRGTVVFTEKSQ